LFYPFIIAKILPLQRKGKNWQINPPYLRRHDKVVSKKEDCGAYRKWSPLGIW
jgi:hypothetical protein